MKNINFKTKLYEKAISNLNNNAVIDLKNNQNYTYLDFINFYYSLRLCNFKNKRIGIYLDKSCDYIISVFGITLTNNSFVPLNPELPDDRLEFIIKDSKIDLIITNEKFINDFKINKNKLTKITINEILNIKNNNIEKEKIKIPFNLNKEIYTIYTSGSTGKPKGVVLTFRGIDNVISQQVNIFELNNSNIFLFLSISFDASLSDIYCSFMSGSTLYINDSVINDTKSFVELLNKNNISYVDIPPSYLKLIEPENLKTIKTIVIGGEVASPYIIKKYSEKFKLINVYGPTEATICTSYSICDNNWSLPYIGKPLDNVEYIILKDDLTNCSLGEEGELYISGIQLAKGYTDKDITNSKFIKIGNKNYFKSGDKVKQDNNGIIFLGRIDRQIKHNGQLICLEEIEQQINLIEEIKSISVIYKENKIYAYYEGDITKENIINFISKKIPKYMIPHYFINSKIPKTINGKNDINKLNIDNRFIGLSKIYSKILNIDFNNLDTNLSFRELGADSIDFISLQIELKNNNYNIPYDYLMKKNKIEDIINFKENIIYSKNDLFNKLENIKLDDTTEINNTNIALLTGFTGNLGSQVLKEIKSKHSIIYCLVRNFEFDDYENIKFIKTTDLSNDFLGIDENIYNNLAKEVTHIYHCAGKVNNLLTFEDLYNDNVKSTINILKFSFKYNLKYIYYASTLSVFVSGTHKKFSTFNEEPLKIDEEFLYNGYAQTKWLSEFMLSLYNKFNNIKIFRFGLLVENNFNKNKNSLINKVISNIINSKEVPEDNLGLSFDYTPLNIAAKIMADYSLPTSLNIYNVSLNNKVYYKEICSFYNKKFIDSDIWFSVYNNELSIYLGLINGDLNNLNLFEMTFVDKFITSINISKYILYCKKFQEML